MRTKTCRIENLKSIGLENRQSSGKYAPSIGFLNSNALTHTPIAHGVLELRWQCISLLHLATNLLPTLLNLLPEFGKILDLDIAGAIETQIKDKTFGTKVFDFLGKPFFAVYIAFSRIIFYTQLIEVGDSFGQINHWIDWRFW